MSNRYKEIMKTEWGTTRHVIRGKKKGILVYRGMRENHLHDRTKMREDSSSEEHTMDYLVFDIPDNLDGDQFLDIFDNGWTGLQIRWFAGWTEISCYYSEVFECGLLSKLQELGYIKYVQKEIPADKDDFPFYVNAKGWRLLYNHINMIRRGIQSVKYRTMNRRKNTQMKMENDKGKRESSI